MSPEAQILVLILGVLALGYFSILPKLARNNIKNVLLIDAAMCLFVLAVVASKYAGAELTYTLLFFDTNWFVFTLVSYGVLESPLSLWYMKKYRIKFEP